MPQKSEIATVPCPSARLSREGNKHHVLSVAPFSPFPAFSSAPSAHAPPPRTCCGALPGPASFWVCARAAGRASAVKRRLGSPGAAGSGGAVGGRDGGKWSLRTHACLCEVPGPNLGRGNPVDTVFIFTFQLIYSAPRNPSNTRF